jgi:hypothetical protein
MGLFDDRVIFSLRTTRRNQNASLMARRVVRGLGQAGGHGAIAGGQIAVKGLIGEKQERIQQNLRNRFLRFVGRANAKGEKLIPPHESSAPHREPLS